MTLSAFRVCFAAVALGACATAPRAPTDGMPSLAAHFSPANAAALEKALVPGCLLVSDADGTLWSDDIGEGFLKRLIADKALVSPEATGDVWATYEAKVKVDKRAGYAWAVQVMAGLTEADVQARAAHFAEEFVPAHAYPAMRALVAAAKARGCEPWIVSASPLWVVKAAAPLMGIDPAHAEGIRVAVKDGLLTTEVVEPVTFRAGKVQAIERYIGRKPAVACGDSSGDLELLASPTGAALFISHAYTAPELLEQARRDGWLVQPL